MMDKDIVSRIEKLLDYPQDITQPEISARMADLEICFRALYPKLPDFSLGEKAIFVKLLTSSNELMRRSMENIMKEFNLTPEKLKNLESGARASNSSESKAFIATLESLNAQAEALRNTISRINTKYSGGEVEGAQGPSSAEQKRLKRSGWYKP
jgi:hypothetical protein